MRKPNNHTMMLRIDFMKNTHNTRPIIVKIIFISALASESVLILIVNTHKNAGNHLLALGPRKAVEKQVKPAYTGGRLPVLFFDNLNFLGSIE